MGESENKLLTSIRKMIPTGNRLELPQSDHFTNYAQVKKCLLDAGGKYKRCGFEFPESAADIQARLLGGEAINDKKKYQYFPTPPPVVQQLLGLAGVTPRCRVLEPSAGQGAIANELRGLAGECVTVELMPQNCVAMRRQGHDVHEADFLTLTADDIGTFDRIVANPPFNKNQDIDHIRHMHRFLRPGGRLVSVASPSWAVIQKTKQGYFREWMESVGANYVDLPEGSFKESGTGVRSMIIVIDKAVDG